MRCCYWCTLRLVKKRKNVPKKICSLKSWFCVLIGDDIFWNFENWSTKTLRKWVSIYRQSQADCLYQYRQLQHFSAYTWGQKRNSFPQGSSGPIFKIPKNVISYEPTEPTFEWAKFVCVISLTLLRANWWYSVQAKRLQNLSIHNASISNISWKYSCLTISNIII